jgi:alkyl sulfatase BDS1-like metallo-beta-lactamase superfamily hydrolase
MADPLSYLYGRELNNSRLTGNQKGQRPIRHAVYSHAGFDHRPSVS